jgi:hypothetical protein
MYHNITFFDKTYFHFGGAVSENNVRFGAREIYVHNFHGRSRHGRKVTGRVVISSHGLMRL